MGFASRVFLGKLKVIPIADGMSGTRVVVGNT